MSGGTDLLFTNGHSGLWLRAQTVHPLTFLQKTEIGSREVAHFSMIGWDKSHGVSVMAITYRELLGCKAYMFDIKQWLLLQLELDTEPR